ncbi:hypothetical protein GcM3_084029 [Golovinomyces cichoracearum]|uniref:Uncharacterized protein n=1 Tax=Golovinomyces cichoracearum TaxID=62708 RepID=A0A420ILT7_9PEZI|nr:hypothetical protein GcM3_084029 [Golovinomyces cichoracearum]
MPAHKNFLHEIDPRTILHTRTRARSHSPRKSHHTFTQPDTDLTSSALHPTSDIYPSKNYPLDKENLSVQDTCDGYESTKQKDVSRRIQFISNPNPILPPPQNDFADDPMKSDKNQA